MHKLPVTVQIKTPTSNVSVSTHGKQIWADKDCAQLANRAAAYLDAGGKGKNEEIEDWRKRAERGRVVTKVAKLGREGEALLQDITRFTNSQNAVREKNFITLDSGFKAKQTAMASKYATYLEIRARGWDSQRAFQKQSPGTKQFTDQGSLDDYARKPARFHHQHGGAEGRVG